MLSILPILTSMVPVPNSGTKIITRQMILKKPGVSAPLGFFDPLGFTSNNITEGRFKFISEAETKHGRVAMLAALGFPIAEQFHPLFGGEVDVPSYIAFQQTPLQIFWPTVLGFLGTLELASIVKFQNPFMGGEPWALKEKVDVGDFGFDPLNLYPSNLDKQKRIKTVELNNGRLAMLAITGMVVQELVSGEKLF